MLLVKGLVKRFGVISAVFLGATVGVILLEVFYGIHQHYFGPYVAAPALSAPVLFTQDLPILTDISIATLGETATLAPLPPVGSVLALSAPKERNDVLAAYADMASPWKELLDYYQQKEDMTVRFQQVVREFFIDLGAPKPS